MNFIKTRIKAVTDFVPFVSSMSFLILIRNLFPSLYNYIETNYANKMVKTDGKFSTINPRNFLKYSTSNSQVIKSTLENFMLTIKCPANVGQSVLGVDLPIIHPQTYEKIQLSDLMTCSNKYYVLNFGSSS